MEIKTQHLCVDIIEDLTEIDGYWIPTKYEIHLPKEAPIELKKEILFHEIVELCTNSHLFAIAVEIKKKRPFFLRLRYDPAMDYFLIALISGVLLFPFIPILGILIIGAHLGLFLSIGVVYIYHKRWLTEIEEIAGEIVSKYLEKRINGETK